MMKVPLCFDRCATFSRGPAIAMLMRRASLILNCLLLTAAPLRAADEAALFLFKIEPLFKEKCLACHGQDGKIKGGYDMSSKAGFFKGGDSEEAAVVSGKPDQSPLYLAIARQHEEDWKPMPPKENDKLSEEQVKWIRQWISAGAPWPDDVQRAELAKSSAKWTSAAGVTVATSGGLSNDWTARRYKPEDLWAYQPVRKPDVKEAGAIDQLVAARFPQGAKPAPRADARTLVRRMTFDLLGMPPTATEVAEFEAGFAKNAEAAVDGLIERLLASPHYGEQWARRWLDVVRYADTSGFANDYERGSAWRYRDYVVRAFNSDKPYDQFVREQLAGDELASPPNAEQLIAAGFLRMGPWELTSMEVAKVARQRFLDDVTNSAGEVFLAHSLQCARCHDHKFDPIPTRDYYSMQACFATTQLAERDAPFLPVENVQGFEERKYLDLRKQEFLAQIRQLDKKLLSAAQQWLKDKKIDPKAWDDAVAKAGKMEAAGAKSKRGTYFSVFEAARNLLMKQGVPEDQFPPKQVGFTTEEFGMDRIARKGLERLRWEYDRYQPVAFTVYDGRTPAMVSVNAPLRMPENRMSNGELEQVAILAGGDPFSPTLPVKPAALSAPSMIAGLDFNVPDNVEGRRTALAAWVTSPKNPLTARVIMNRVWLWHFGQPLAGNPNNFGGTGKKPTNPELLDWLAATLVEKGWSLKSMHRLILKSAAYQRSSSAPDKDSKLSRGELESAGLVFKPRRLMAEELRDSMLAVSGELNPVLGGIPVRPEINLEAALQPRQVMGTFATAWQPNPLPEQRHRRSLYVLKIRGLRDPFMEVFNEPGPDFSCEARDASNVTPQVFSLFNGQPSYDRALALARRLLNEHAKAPLEALFRSTLGRTPTAGELEATQTHWQAMTARHQATRLESNAPPLSVVREAVEENTGEKFRFNEPLHVYQDFKPDIDPATLTAEIKGLAEVCLVLFNSNEFAYLY